MSAIIIRPPVFAACYAALHATSAGAQHAAREQVIAPVEAGADTPRLLNRLVAAFAGAFAAERLGVSSTMG